MDKRVQKTKKNILDAFMLLIEKKEAHKITVSEIAKLANIERKTFYLHYACIEDIYRDIDEYIINTLKEEINKVINDHDQYRNIYKNLNYAINKHINFLRAISINDSNSLILHQLENILTNVISEIAINAYHVNSKNTKYYASFYAAGIIRLYKDWLRGETNLTLDELTRILTRVSFMSAEDLFMNK